MPDPLFPSHAVFHNTLAAVKRSSEEQVRIERTIGRAMLDKMTGKATDLTVIYRSLGGEDPISKQMFRDINPHFTRLDVSVGAKAAQEVALRPGTAASKSSVVRDNPLFGVDNTALNTLAELGGPEFREKFNVG